mgnify:FL=1
MRIRNEMNTIDLIIDKIGDQLKTYNILRNYTFLPLSEIKSKIDNYEIIASVSDIKLIEIKRIRKLIDELNNIGTNVIVRDVTGAINLGILANIIATYEQIESDIDDLDEVMFSGE